MAKVLKHFDAQWITTDKGNIKNMKATTEGNYPAVALIGNSFMNGEFMFASEIEKSYKGMDGTYHNLNHGKNHDGRIDIQDIVGFHENTEYDKETKQMKIQIHPEEDMPTYKTWMGFLKLNYKAKTTPNVSIETYANEKQIKASEIKELINLEDNGLKEDDEITALYDYDFVGAATVKEGACNASDGCGIGICENIPDTDTNTVTMNTTEFPIVTINVDPSSDRILEKSETIKEKIMAEEEKPKEEPKEPVEEPVEEKPVETPAEPKVEPEVKEESKEVEALKKQMKELAEKNKELETKLNKPITTIAEANKPDEKAGIKALRSMGIE